ncbi:MAG: hypothetical protein ACI8PZ_000298 [Myxococcota bacterium]|jgi:hypothetical protein
MWEGDCMVLRLGITAGLIAILSACAADGKIKLEDQEKFGRVKSAVWFEFKQQLPDSGGDQFHQFWMGDRGRLCVEMQEAAPVIAQSWLDTIGSIPTNADELETCERHKQYWTTLADATAPLYDKGFNQFVFDFKVPGRERREPPEEEVYAAGYDDQDPFFNGTLTYIDENPYRAVADELDCADYDWYETPNRVLPDVLEEYIVADGDAEITIKNDSVRKVEFKDGELLDVDGDPAGGIEAKGKFTYCEVEFTGALEYLVQAPPLLDVVTDTTADPTPADE